MILHTRKGESVRLGRTRELLRPYCSAPWGVLRTILLLLLMTVGVNGAWGQTGPVEITTDANENGTIEDSEKKLYLIQTNAFPSFYIAPQANNTITTNNILGEYLLWYFLDAGEDNGTQYYYIVNKSTGKYIYNHNGNDRGINITDFAALSDDNKEKCKFKLVVNNTNGTGFYNINVKANQTYYGLNKQNGSQANANPIRLTNTQYINDVNSTWKFIPFNGTFTYPTPPFTPSSASETHYYEIHNVQKNTYYASTDATPDKVIFTNQASESRAWYFKEAASDTWYKYYYIINPSTGGKYMYYEGTDDNTSNQTDAVSVKTYDSNNENRYQFVVVQAARGDGNSRVECYAIIPKLLIDNLWTSNRLGLATEASITNGANMGIINSRIEVKNNNAQPNGAHWIFDLTDFTTVCANPVIAFDRNTGKASITTTTSQPSIYYTTDETTPSSSNGTLYNEPFALTEQTTVKAIVTKDGYTDSEVTTLTINKVATPTIQQETGTHNVSITTTTPGATIYYTTDGSNPTTSSTLYTGASEELGGKPIKAIAVKDGMINSDVGEGTVDIRCVRPDISFDNITSMVTITCETEGSTIHYTTDNSEPTVTSTAYSGSFSVTSPTTVKAIATHTTLNPSAVVELVIPQVATPTIQNNGSNAVSITTTTVGATIYYTTDGSAPTTSSTVYNTPLSDDVSGVTIKAIAVKDGMITSAVGSNVVTLCCSVPDIARSSDTSFTISCSFPASGVTIYYTTDGSTPTTSSSSISSDGIVSCTLPITVKAIAVATNYNNSEVATANLKDDLDGEGTVGNPYTLKYQTDVADFVQHANTPEGASLHYKVVATKPLDFSGAAPITQAFSGTFDGGTQLIANLKHPLFNTVDGGVVKNVTLKNVAIESDAEYVGAIAGVAQGYSRIYNCGILPNDATFPEGTHPTVTGGTCAGGIVGKLDGDSRVINCYSYADVSATTYAAGIVGQNTFASTAEVSSGKYTKLKTAVVNCMFYGDITGGTNQYGVYGGTLITNAAATGISSYNYYRNGSTFTTLSGEPTAYNCSFPADERYLTQVEFHRSLLNSNRELCGWWVGSDVAPSTMTTAEVQAIPKDASLMYKWVVDPNLAPYPILKPFGKYPSIINTNTGTPWFDRTTAAPFEGQQLGTLSVFIKKNPTDANPEHLNIPITDMDSLHYDFGYRKVQLPYYNTVFGNPDGATWEEKYAGNYTNQVVTGWKIIDVSGGTQGSFVADWQYGYNFADRNCTQKDLYSVSGRVFAQGGYYYVPDNVSEITIEAYWGKAIYVRNNGGYYDRVNITLGSTGTAFAPAGTRDNNVNNATIQTTSIKNTLNATNIDAKKTVYDYALVLVGNVQESVSNADVVHATENTRGFTIMSVDLDFDEEPDYCLEWQLGKNVARQVIAPIRFDFLPVVELGIAGKLHDSTNFFSLGCYRSKGHFEVTETAFIRFGQFEFELGTRDDGPIILNGGIYDQYCRGRNGETNQHINYVILGGHIVMPSFTPGAHVNNAAKYQTRHCAVNVLGGDFTSFYLTGGYNEGIKPFEDNPHCYIDGGRFGTIAAAYKEGIWGDVTWRINHALIGEFYGGGVMAQATGDTYKIVKGSIDVVIDNSIVGKYCGGPKFGNMVSGKTVTTSASNTVFTQFFGAGNGGTNYMQYANTDANGVRISDWSTTITSNYTPGKYRSKDQGYAADYDIEVINTSTGDLAGQVVNRSYYYSAQFATTNTGNVTSTLNNCTINTNFYGGGFLGGVTGDVTSTLSNCTVRGFAFGAGYSASAGTVNIHNKDKVPPVPNTYTGMIKPQSGGTFTTYEWTNTTTFGSTTLSTESPTISNPNGDGKNYIYTEVSLVNLGSVTGNVTLTINGTTTVGESVFGGGESSNATGNTTVNVIGGTVTHDVYGGGALANVVGNTKVNLIGGTVTRNVYGGGMGRMHADAVGTEGQSGYVAEVTPVAATVGSATVNLNGIDAADYISAYTTLAQNGSSYTVKDAEKGCIVRGDIFGCNNLNGTPLGTVTVHVYATQNAAATSIANTTEDETAKVKGRYDVQHVYGGGNLAAYEPTDALLDYTVTNNKPKVDAAHTTVIIDGCDRTSIYQVYGGGNAASTPGTEVTINGTFEIEEVFGGGNGKDDITINNVTKPNPGANVGYYAYADDLTYEQRNNTDTSGDVYVYGSGKAQVNIHGGTIHYVYGGSNTKGNVRQIAVAMLEELQDDNETAICDFVVDEAYGGGKSAPMDGEAKLEMKCIPGLNAAYGGAENADIHNNVTLNITNGLFGQVFGGNNRGGRIMGRITVNIEETGCRPIIIGELYGGGNRAAYSVYGYKPETDDNGQVVTDTDGKEKWQPLEARDDAETIGGVVYEPLTETTRYADPVVNVKSFTSIGDIYGGGYGETAKMVGDPTVNINVVLGDKRNHLEAAISTEQNIEVREDIDGENHQVTYRHLHYPSHEKGKIGAINNVFGGGNAAKVIGSPTVNIGTEATVDYVTLGKVDNVEETTPREDIPVVGADIRGNVYGGGNNAVVTGNTNVVIGKRNE